MNKKGFTLVELLAVIVVLSGLSLIVVSSINSTLERREEKEVNEQKELAINAAKIYFSLESGTSVKISELINENYLSSDKASKLDKNNCVVIVNNEYKIQGC